MPSVWTEQITPRNLFMHDLLILSFRNKLLNSIFNSFNPKGFKDLSRFCPNISHKNAHRFQHIFQSYIIPFCSCMLETEFATLFFLHCHHYTNIRIILINYRKLIDDKILCSTDDNSVKILLFSEPNYNK